MATFKISQLFQKKVFSLCKDIAKYSYRNGECGYSVAKEFQATLSKKIQKTALAPLQNSSDWVNPQRRTFFEYRGQYTVVFLFSPYTATSNAEVQEIILTNIYPSRSLDGNKAYPEEISFDVDDLLKD